MNGGGICGDNGVVGALVSTVLYVLRCSGRMGRESGGCDRRGARSSIVFRIGRPDHGT